MLRHIAAEPATAETAMSGRRSRDKGARAERALVRFLQERGFAAEVAQAAERRKAVPAS